MKRLILVEGLPGTGKTTISRWLSDILVKKGEEVILLNEGDERIPCDFYETAGIPKDEFELLCINNPSTQAFLRENTLMTANYAFLRIDKCPDPIGEKIKRWDMGDEYNRQVTVAEYIPCALERLQYWVNANIQHQQIVVMDSGYLQNPINELLFRRASNEEVCVFINAITSMLKLLNPICIYLRRNNADEAIAFAKKVKGADWAARIDKLLNQCGFENTFRQRFELELALLPHVEHIICHINGDDWAEAKKMIQDLFE